MSAISSGLLTSLARLRVNCVAKAFGENGAVCGFRERDVAITCFSEFCDWRGRLTLVLRIKIFSAELSSLYGTTREVARVQVAGNPCKVAVRVGCMTICGTRLRCGSLFMECWISGVWLTVDYGLSVRGGFWSRRRLEVFVKYQIVFA